MSAPMDKRRPYARSMGGWWKRDPYFIRYLAMEATSVLVAVYALILLIGLYRLSQGELAYNENLSFNVIYRKIHFAFIIGEYPEGIMYAVLLMNAVTPLIDRLCKRIPAGGKPNVK